MCSLPVGWGALASFLPATQGLPPRSGHSHVWVESKLLNEAIGPQENHCYLPSSATTPYLSCPSLLPSRRGTPRKQEGLCDHILGWQARLEAEASLASGGRQVAAGGAPWKEGNLRSFSISLLGLFLSPLSVALELFGRHLETAGETALIQLKRLTLWAGSILVGRRGTHRGCFWFHL